MKKIKIAIIGSGYVGLPLSLEFSRFFSVISYDLNKVRINELNNLYDRNNEFLKKDFFNKKIEFTFDIKKLKNCNFYIITVPTPIKKSNKPDLSYLLDATKMVAKYIKKKDIVIYESTTFPGCTDNVCIPILEEYSQLSINKDFGVGYSPERINPGDKINTIRTIKKVVSASDRKTLEKIKFLYRKIIKPGIYPVSSIKVAEAAKVIENTQRDINIGFVNELSIIFQRMDIDTREVLDAASTKWNFHNYNPGMVGGHCISVDPYYLSYESKRLGYTPQILLSGRRINEKMAKYAALMTIRKMKKNNISIKNSRIAILGITFKENCPDIRNTKIIDLIKELKACKAKLFICDPYADPGEVYKQFRIRLFNINNLNKIDTTILAVWHAEYKSMPIKFYKKISNFKKQPVFSDLKSCYDKNLLEKNGFTVFRL
jgi:UDP-N-acetyl-D-galactosamine dehydrogenase